MSVKHYTRKPKPHEICTKDNPYDAKINPDRLVHLDAVPTGEKRAPADSQIIRCKPYVQYLCPNCGYHFWELEE